MDQNKLHKLSISLQDKLNSDNYNFGGNFSLEFCESVISKSESYKPYILYIKNKHKIDQIENDILDEYFNMENNTYGDIHYLQYEIRLLENELECECGYECESYNHAEHNEYNEYNEYKADEL